MHVPGLPGPLFDHNWDSRSRAREIEDAQRQSGTNGGRIAWEIGIIMLVPLVGSVVIEMLLKAFRVT